MVGNAKIEGLLEDLNMSGTQYNVALAIFFIPYVLLGMANPTIPKKNQKKKSLSISNKHTRGSVSFSGDLGIRLHRNLDTRLGNHYDAYRRCAEFLSALCDALSPWCFRVSTCSAL